MREDFARQGVGNLEALELGLPQALLKDGRAPLDQASGLIHSFSPALVRLSARAAARQGYQGASEDLHALAAIAIQGRQIQRLVNQVAPQVAVQLEQGPSPDLHNENKDGAHDRT